MCKLLNQIKDAYHRAPYFKQVFPVLEAAMQYDDRNLFRFLHNTISAVCAYLKINTRIAVSSGMPIDHTLKSQDKVMALCRCVDAGDYINSIGGVDLYSKDDFLAEGIALKFIKSNPFAYQQFENAFIPWLSIIDVMMFNAVDDISAYLASDYTLL